MLFKRLVSLAIVISLLSSNMAYAMDVPDTGPKHPVLVQPHIYKPDASILPEGTKSEPQAIVSPTPHGPANQIQSHSGSSSGAITPDEKSDSGSNSSTGSPQTNSPQKSPREEGKAVPQGISPEGASVQTPSLIKLEKRDETASIAPASMITVPAQALPSSVTLDERTPLISRARHQDEDVENLLAPSQNTPPAESQPSLMSRAWNIAGRVAGYFTRRGGKASSQTSSQVETPSQALTMESPSPIVLLPNDDEDSDGSDVADKPAKSRADAGLGQPGHSINQAPQHGSSKELDDLSMDGKSWTLLAAPPRPELVPDRYKTVPGTKKDSEGKDANDKAVAAVSETAPLLSTDDDDPEKGRGSSSFLDNFPSKAKIQLLRIKLQDLNEKLTWAQMGAIGAGFLVGTGTAIALAPVWRGGIFYIDERYGGRFIDYLMSTDTATYYIIISSLFDAIPRNATLIKQAVTYVAEETVQVGRTILTGLASFLPSLLEPAYLVIAETHIMKLANKHGVNNQYAETMLALCPFLFLDSMIANFDMTWEMWDDLKEWAGKSSSHLARCLSDHMLPRSRLSPEETLKQDFDKKINSFRHILFKMPENQVSQEYDTIFNSQTTLQQALPTLEKDDFDIAHSFLALRYSLDSGNQIEKIQRKLRSWYDTLTDSVTYGTLALGSVARLLALVIVIQTFFDFFTPQNVSEGLGWGFGVLGFPLQTGLEYMAIKKFFYDFIQHEEPHSYGSYPIVRGIAKGVSAIQGLIFTAPLAVLCLQVCNAWFTSNPEDFMHSPLKVTNYPGYYITLTSSVFFLLSEFTNLTNQFNSTYNQQVVTGLTDFYRWIRKKVWNEGPGGDSQQDELLRLLQRQQNKIKRLDSFTLHYLQQDLQQKKEK